MVELALLLVLSVVMNYKLKMFIMFLPYLSQYTVYFFTYNYRIIVFALALKAVYFYNFRPLRRKPLLDKTTYIWMPHHFVLFLIQMMPVMLLIAHLVCVVIFLPSKKKLMKKRIV